ncbi:MAG: DNA repair protein RecO [Bacteriovoracia bacterium]
MHHIYKTRAIILNSQPIKEADKQLVLLTEEFGLIKAIAQGTRKIESKLRQSIQDFSVSEVALVKGKAGWRLTNARIDYFIPSKIENQKLFKSVVRNFNLIERLVLGESEDDLFDLVLEFVEFAIENQKQILHEDQVNNFESIFVYQILNILGYISQSNFDDNEFDMKKLDLKLINQIALNDRKKINRIINHSIKTSGL